MIEKSNLPFSSTPLIYFFFLKNIKKMLVIVKWVASRFSLSYTFL